MKNFVLEVVGYSYNQVDDETKARLAGYYDSQLQEFNINASLDIIMDDLLKITGNVFVHELTGYGSEFIFDALEAKGYVFYERFDVNTERHEKFVRVNKRRKDEVSYGDFTVYTKNPKNPDGYDMLNFKDTTAYLPESLEDLAYYFGMTYYDIEDVPFGADKEPTGYDKQNLKDHLKILDKAMSYHDFYRAYENRIYSMSNMAMQVMLAGVEKLDLKMITEFEPKNKFTGFQKVYAVKRYKKLTPESSRTKRPRDLQLVSRPKTEALLDELEELIDLMEEMLEEKDYTNYKSKQYLLRKISQAKRYYMAQKGQMTREVKNENARISYRSGYNFLNPYLSNDWIEGVGVTLDKNSQFPSIYGSKKLPADYIDHVDNLDEFNKKYGNGDFLYIAQVSDLKAVCKDDYVPILKPKKSELASLGTVEQVLKSENYNYNLEMHHTYLAQPDFEYFLEAYDIKELNYSLMVLSVDYELMEKLKAHQELWSSKKEEAKRNKDALGYRFAKGMLNYVVGYLGVNKGYRDSSKSYVAVSSFINSYSRVNTARIINKIGLEHYCYSAVDSLHFLLPEHTLTNGEYDKDKAIAYFQDELGLEIDPVKTGTWKIENVWKKAKYINTNVYGELNIFDEWHSTVSGYTQQIPMDKFEGNTLLTRYVNTVVKGGVIVKPSDYVLEKMEIFD